MVENNRCDSSDGGREGARRWVKVSISAAGVGCILNWAWMDRAEVECIPGMGVLATGKSMICAGLGGAKLN